MKACWTPPKRKKGARINDSRFLHLRIWAYSKNECENLHPGRLTWNLQITNLERKMIFQTSIIMFHVNLPGCILESVPDSFWRYQASWKFPWSLAWPHTAPTVWDNVFLMFLCPRSPGKKNIQNPSKGSKIFFQALLTKASWKKMRQKILPCRSLRCSQNTFWNPPSELPLYVFRAHSADSAGSP